jgi:hypothetical protein
MSAEYLGTGGLCAEAGVMNTGRRNAEASWLNRRAREGVIGNSSIYRVVSRTCLNASLIHVNTFKI